MDTINRTSFMNRFSVKTALKSNSIIRQPQHMHVQASRQFMHAALTSSLTVCEKPCGSAISSCRSVRASWHPTSKYPLEAWRALITTFRSHCILSCKSNNSLITTFWSQCKLSCKNNISLISTFWSHCLTKIMILWSPCSITLYIL